MKSKNKWYKWIYLQNRSRVTDVENKFVVLCVVVLSHLSHVYLQPYALLPGVMLGRDKLGDRDMCVCMCVSVYYI